jgi:hypothetical protein
MNQDYYYVLNGTQLGPVSKATLDSLALDPNTLVWCDGMPDWKTYSSLYTAMPVTNENVVWQSNQHQATPPAQKPLGTQYSSGDLLNNDLSYPKPKDYMTHSIIALVVNLLVCTIIGLIPGILGVVFSNQVNNKYYLRDFVGAEQASKNARTCFIISMVLIGLTVLIFAGIFIFAFQQAGSGFWDAINE